MIERGKATLKAVAEIAGVSVAAASKVLNGGGATIRVSDETAELIRKAAADLQYEPNRNAQSLRTNRSQTVGLVFENFGRIAEGPQFYIQLLDGLAEELFRHHYCLTIIPEIDRERPLQFIGGGRVDGVLWCKMPESSRVAEKLQRSQIPCVAMHAGSESHGGQTVYVSCDNRAGSRLAVDHLVGLGHARILFVLEESETVVPDAQERLNGYREAMESHGLDTRGSDVVVWSSDTEEFASWWNAKSGHTAIFAWNERMAGEILKRAVALGLSVPDDLSVVGFDSTPYCESTTPPLTAVRQPIRKMAAQAAHTLIDMIEGRPQGSNQHVFPCTLDVRGSSGRCRAALGQKNLTDEQMQ